VSTIIRIPTLAITTLVASGFVIQPLSFNWKLAVKAVSAVAANGGGVGGGGAAGSGAGAGGSSGGGAGGSSAAGSSGGGGGAAGAGAGSGGTNGASGTPNGSAGAAGSGAATSGTSSGTGVGSGSSPSMSSTSSAMGRSFSASESAAAAQGAFDRTSGPGNGRICGSACGAPRLIFPGEPDAISDERDAILGETVRMRQIHLKERWIAPVHYFAATRGSAISNAQYQLRSSMTGSSKAAPFKGRSSRTTLASIHPQGHARAPKSSPDASGLPVPGTITVDAPHSELDPPLAGPSPILPRAGTQ
jgi:hypothetical protein